MQPLTAGQLRDLVIEAQHEFGRIAKVPDEVWDALLKLARGPSPSLTQRELDAIFDGALGERRARPRDTQESS